MTAIKRIGQKLESYKDIGTVESINVGECFIFLHLENGRTIEIENGKWKYSK